MYMYAYLYVVHDCQLIIDVACILHGLQRLSALVHLAAKTSLHLHRLLGGTFRCALGALLQASPSDAGYKRRVYILYLICPARVPR